MTASNNESKTTKITETTPRHIGVYPGDIDTDFYRESHDYVSTKKQHTFMPASDLAEVILFNLVNNLNLTVSDIRIDRNPIAE